MVGLALDPVVFTKVLRVFGLNPGAEGFDAMRYQDQEELQKSVSRLRVDVNQGKRADVDMKRLN